MKQIKEIICGFSFGEDENDFEGLEALTCLTKSSIVAIG